MADRTEGARSEEACPVCGAHRLALIPYPAIDVMQVRPLDELYGFSDPAARGDASPAIGCLNCGAEWADLAEFRRASSG